MKKDNIQQRNRKTNQRNRRKPAITHKQVGLPFHEGLSATKRLMNSEHCLSLSNVKRNRSNDVTSPKNADVCEDGIEINDNGDGRSAGMAMISSSEPEDGAAISFMGEPHIGQEHLYMGTGSDEQNCMQQISGIGLDYLNYFSNAQSKVISNFLTFQ